MLNEQVLDLAFQSGTVENWKNSTSIYMHEDAKEAKESTPPTIVLRMKTLLISPPFAESYGKNKPIAPEYPPLGLAYLGAMLESENRDVSILDMGAEGMTLNGLHPHLQKESPEIVGVTVVTATAAVASKIAAIVKKVLPNSWVVFGGPHPSASPTEVAKDANVDIVVVGEGEHTLLDLIKSYDSKKALKNVRGIAFRESGDISIAPPRPLIENLDGLPYPAWNLLPIKRYNYPFNTRRRPLVNVMTSRGCPFRCVYCAKAVFGRVFRARDPVKVVDEIEYLINGYGIREVHFSDDVFTLDRNRAKRICDEMMRRNLDITWACPNGIRVDSIDRELLVKMKESGCYSLAFGVESGNQEVLKKIGKGTTLDQARRAVRACKEVGIEVWCYFMFGLPGDDERTMRDTIGFAKELDPDLVKFHITVPLPGSDLFSYLEENDLIRSKDWSRYAIFQEPLYEYPDLSPKTIMRYYKKAYREFYLRPGYMTRRILKVRGLYDFKCHLHAFASVLGELW